MSVRVMIPTPLRRFTDEHVTVDIPGDSVGEALSNLTELHSGLRKHLYTPEGTLRSFVNVYLNDEDVRYLEKDLTPLKSGDVLTIVPSIAGGAA